MGSLLEKIEASAAKRLVLPGDRPASEELGRFKTFLKVESHRLKLMHRAGAGGIEICRGRADMIDVLLRYLWLAAKNTLSPQAQDEFPPLALAAIGGYGRSELNPLSDIDVMFLHAGQVVAGSKPLPHLSTLTDGVLLPLWDLGFKVGHSVRSISDCVSVANENLQSKTSLIESHLVVGDEPLFAKFQRVVVSKCVSGHEDEYIRSRIEDQQLRRAKYGNSATMQEPNIKNGCGGLRDYHNLLWMAFFKYRTRSLTELERRELVTASERKRLRAGYDFLLRTRSELHYQVDRLVDVLSKNLQATVAYHLGYTARSPRERIEAFMGDFYYHTRQIYLITRTLEERLALLPKPKVLESLARLLPGRRGAETTLLDGFKITSGQIRASSARVFKEQPRRLMRVFLYAQQRGLRLHPDLCQQIRGDLALVNRSFLTDSHVRETFLEILNQRGSVAPVLRAMHEVGMLGKYIPEFGKITCLVQHEFYHRYTADEHTLVCLEKLDSLWEAKTPPGSNYAELLAGIERPFVLYLALLLHDAGKATGKGRHTEEGGRIALRAAKRLGLDGATTHSLCLVIENHLAMAQISQRRDLEDPNVVRQFASLIQTAENLQMLTLHTYADSLGTSETLWNSFKDSLLWLLYKKAMHHLAGGSEYLRHEAKQRELLIEQVRELLPRSIEDAELHAHFTHLPQRYFQIHPAREVATDISLAHRFMHLQLSERDEALEPVLSWQNDPDRACTRLKLCTWDRAGLFSKIAGPFSAAGINILSAQIFTRNDGIAIDTFFVNSGSGAALVSREERERFESLLFETLSGNAPDFRALLKSRPPARRLYQSHEGEEIPTQIHFDNDISHHWTLIEIETEDRIGLLFTISEILFELHLDVALAKIITEKGAAIDTFYVSEHDGQKIAASARQKFIADRLRSAIASLAR